MKLDTIYKKTKTGKVQEWTIEVKGSQYRTISGQTDGEKITNNWSDCEIKNAGKANATTPEEQCLKEAEAKRKKKLESGYFESIKDINKVQYFDLPRALKCFLHSHYQGLHRDASVGAIYEFFSIS
jgi:hypothetical protein